jgi:hypothetical protein
LQNLAPTVRVAPQDEHATSNLAPHCSQKRASPALTYPHLAVAVLLKHLKINGLSARVTVKTLAVGDQNGEATLYTADTDGMGRLGEPNDQIADRLPLQLFK